MRDKLWRMAYDRYHTQETDPEKRKENEERYHALVKMLAAVERQNLLQDIEEKKLLNCDADFESFIDGLEGAMASSTFISRRTSTWTPPSVHSSARMRMMTG